MDLDGRVLQPGVLVVESGGDGVPEGNAAVVLVVHGLVVAPRAGSVPDIGADREWPVPSGAARLATVDQLTEVAFAARAGDRTALARLVRATQVDVWRLSAHLVDSEAADDLTQECFERAIRALPRFEGRSSVKVWLLAIARRTCMDELRRRTRRRALLSRVTDNVGRDSFLADDPAGGVSLDALVAALPEERRSAFVLTQVLGMGYAEAATICDCPVGTIRSRVARAREQLAAAMADEGGSHGLAEGTGG